VRDLSNLLRPSALDDLGLAAALRALAGDVSERSRLPVTLAITGTHAIPADLEVVLYRVMQEALTNAVRHAGASQVRAQLEIGGAGVTLTVEDDGQGLSPGVHPNLGWLGMQERVTAVGGTLTVAGYHAPGVRVEARIPVAATS
jgi:signal transduction histidine kinase